MNEFFISYDLRKPGRNYEPVHEYIQGLPDWCKPLQSLYIVRTSLSARQVTEALMARCDSNDRILVMSVDGRDEWWSNNLDSEVVDWLHKAVA